MRVRIEGAVGMFLYRNRGEGLPRSAEPRNVGPCEQSREGGHVTPCAFSHGCARLAMISVASFVETDVIFSPPATRASSDWPLATAIQPARKAAPPLPLVYSTFIAEAGSNPSSLTRRFARPEMPSNSPLAMFPTNTSSNRTPSRPASSIAAREASASRPTTSLSLLPNFVVAQPTIATDRIPAGDADLKI